MQTPEEIELNQVCQQLDEILHDFFCTLKQLLVNRQELDKTMKDGFFLMARARYSMGVKSVSSCQYNNEDLQKAFSSVNLAFSPDGFISFQPELTSSKPRTPAIGIVRNSKEVGLSDENGSECVELDQMRCSALDTNGEQKVNIPSGLRRRNVQKDPDHTDEPSAVSTDVSAVEDLISGVDCMTCDDEMTEKSVQAPTNISPDATGYGKDPILWFGVLVPQPLRQSQTAFKSAIEILCQIAALQNRLVRNKVIYEEKMAKKCELMALCKKLDADKNINKELDDEEDSSSASVDCPSDK